MTVHAPRVARIFKGAYANIYGRIVVATTQLAGVPILIHLWGAEVYGEWLILFAIPFCLSMADLGFSQSAGNDMTQRVARADPHGALCVFQSLLVLVFAAAAVGIVIVTALVAFVPVSEWLPLQAISPGDAHLILWLFAAEVFVKLTEGVSHAGFRASQAYPFHTAIYYTTLLLQYCAMWLLAALGPVAAAAAFLSVRAAVTPIVAVLLIRRHPWLQYGLAHARLSELRRLLKPALANVSFPLAQALNVQGMVLVVGAVLGPLAVVVFSTLRTLTRLALQAILSISHAAEPELAAVYGMGDRTHLCQLYEQITRVGLWLALAVCGLLAVGGDWIVAIWTHGAVSMNDHLFRWLLATGVTGSVWYSGLIVLKSANLHLRAAYLYFASASLALVVAYAALSTTGHIETAGMTLLVVDGAMAAYTLRAAGRVCGDSMWRLLWSAMNPTALFRLAWRRAHVN